MSLIAKIQQQSLLQNKLQAQLAEMSYQAVNGTRQTPRNFREGTLEIGKMHFTTPQDRITKEMVMDYQQTEQEKHYTDSAGNKLKYDPTGLSDVLDTYKPIDYGPLAAPATVLDIRNYEQELSKLYDELNVLTSDTQAKNVEIKAQERDILAKDKEVDDKNKEYAETQKYWRKLNADLTKVQDLLAALTGPNASPGNTTNIAKDQKKEKEIEDNIKIEDAKLKTLQAELVPIQKELITLKDDLKVLKGEHTVIINNTKAKEKEIGTKASEIEQAKQNIN